MINYKLIKQKRVEKGMTQEQLASLVGYDNKCTVSKLESGTQKDIPLSKLVKISKVLEVEVNELIKGGYHVEV